MYKIVDSKQTEKSVVIKLVLDTLWSNEVNKASINQAKNIKLHGFRKGKVPFEQAKKYLNFQTIFQSAFANCMRLVIPLVSNEAQVKDANVLVDATPDVSIDQMNENSVSVFLEFMRSPKIDLPDYHQIKVSAQKQTITDDDVKKEIKNILNARSEMVVKKGDVVEKDDIVIVTYTGKIDGKVDDRLCAKSSEISGNDPTSIPGFFDHLLGMKVGEEKSFSVKLPKEQAEDLSEKEVEFSVKVDELKTLNCPALDEKLVDELTNHAVKSVGEFDGWVKQNLQDLANERYVQLAKEEILRYLLENAKFNYVPSKMVESEYQRRISNLDRFFESRMNVNFEKAIEIDGLKVDEVKKSLHDEVENNIKILFILRQIANHEHLRPTSEDLNQYRDSLKNSPDPKERQLTSLADDELMDQLVNQWVIDALYKWNCMEV